MAWLLVTIAVLVVVVIASVSIGSRTVSLDEILAALGGSTDGLG
ncbi:iron ABC transporter permease, partial [Dietzia sp. DQ12-76]|nr:iron ABC transporter permease [Dietzia sp. DQ12-76]